MTEHYDAIVIGTGQSGPSLAVRLANAGRKTAIIERKLFGGSCVNVGCIPTKTLITSARAAIGIAADGDDAVTRTFSPRSRAVSISWCGRSRCMPRAWTEGRPVAEER